MGQSEKRMPDKLNSQNINEPSLENEENQENENLDGEINNLEANESDKSEAAEVPRAPRSQLRAAINSVYNIRPYTENPSLVATSLRSEVEETTPTPVTEEHQETREVSETDLLIERAEILARDGKHERARQLYSQAVRLAPENSDGWCGLGRLLVEANPERARYCFQRALALDPENKLAELMLKTVEEEEQLSPPKQQALMRLEDVGQAERGLQTSSADGEAAPRPPVKIGLEEALAAMRESGVEADPNNMPVGGARLRQAIESGVLKPGRIRSRRRRLPLPRLPRISISGLALSLFLLISLAVLSGVGLYFVVAQPSFEPPPPTATPLPTASPLPTLGPEETFAGRLRIELERYNRQLVSIKNLVEQQRANKLQWEDFRKNFDDLQKQLKEQKKAVDTMASSVMPRLLTPYRGLQDLSLTMLNAVDYMVSGIHNYEPDDLDEALRQFTRASAQLAEAAKQVDQLAPLPTPTSVPATVTLQPTLTITSAPVTTTVAAGGTTSAAPTLTPVFSPTADSVPTFTATPPITSTPGTTETATATATP